MEIASIDMLVVTAALQWVVWANVTVAAALLTGVILFAICCGRDWLRARKQRTILGVALLALGTSACSPRFQHLDGTSLTPIRAPLSLENGWLVFDSCAAGIHALIEIQVAANASHVRPPDLEQVAFRYVSASRWRMGRVRVDGPFCQWERSDGPASTRAALQHAPLDRTAYGMQPLCTYVVLAQFDLDRLPKPGDSLETLHGERVMRIAWR